ncbi:MAG: hypothetical protein H0X01_10895 [Nitrospira sp.]|nr:hypothetical protein [Nitrospira sp.]
MRLMTLIWKHRLVLLLSIVVSLAVVIPVASIAPVTYTSSGEFLIPTTDPLTGDLTDTSPLGRSTDDYARESLADDVRVGLESNSDELISISATRDNDQDETYSLVAEASSASVATEGVSLGAKILSSAAETLSASQISSFNRRVVDELVDLEVERTRIHKLSLVQARKTESLRDLIAVARSTGDADLKALEDELSKERVVLAGYQQRIDLIKSKSENLKRLIANVNDVSITRVASSSLISSPSIPTTGSDARLIQLAGIAVLAGLTVALLVTLWLERRTMFGWRRTTSSDMRLHRENN